VNPIAKALLLVVVASALGCGEKTTGGASDSGPPGPHVAKFKIGAVVASGGIVTIETDSFRQGDPISISFEVKNPPPKSQARVVWSDSSKRKISEEQKQPASGTGAVSFQMKRAQDLEVGEYLVELFYGDSDPAPGKWTSLGTKSFRVGPKRPS
jgi:hypothetical protein